MMEGRRVGADSDESETATNVLTRLFHAAENPAGFSMNLDALAT